jgi:sulfur carrier protein ThiS
MCRDIGTRETQVEFPEDSPGTTVTLSEVLDRLGVTLSDSEGSLLVIVNGEVIPPEEADRFRLHDRDHVGLYMILAGG